jgi:hypothetical protein
VATSGIVLALLMAKVVFEKIPRSYYAAAIAVHNMIIKKSPAM